MAQRYSRKEFLARLRAEIGRGRPLVMTGAGNGICAKFIERGGVDILGVYNTGYFRMQGYGSLAGMLPMADANQMVYDMGRREVLPQVKEVPVVAGLNGVDVLRDMPTFPGGVQADRLFRRPQFPDRGVVDGEFRRTLEGTGLGYEHEINMLNIARRLDLLTIGYAFGEEDAVRLMKEAGSGHFHFSRGHYPRRLDRLRRGSRPGGRRETQPGAFRHRQADQARCDPAGPRRRALSNPEDAQFMLDHTDCHGVQLGSSIERLAIERPLQERAAAFKAVRFPKGASEPPARRKS